MQRLLRSVRDLNSSLLSAISHHPIRTVLSVVGITIASSGFIAIMTLGMAVEAVLVRSGESRTQPPDISIVAEEGRWVDGLWMPLDSIRPLSRNTLESLRAAIGGELRSFSALQRATSWLTPGDDGRRRAVEVLGLLDIGSRPIDISILTGRDLTLDELRQDTPVTLIPLALAREIADSGEVVVGRSINLGTAEFQVVGVFADPMASSRFRVIVPYYAVGSFLAGSTPLAEAAVYLREGACRRCASESTHNWLMAHGLQGRFRQESGKDRLRQAQRELAVVTYGLGAIVAISLLVGAVGIVNVMIASVVERTREIGIRRAVGATRRSIALQFISESALITGTGGMLGAVIGLVLAAGVTVIAERFSGVELILSLNVLMLTATIAGCAVIGACAGAYPARLAAQVTPVDALRAE